MKGLIFVVGAVVFWGITPIFEKLAFREKPDPFVLLWFRAAIVLVALSAGLLVAGKFGELQKYNMRGIVYSGIAGLCAGLIAQVCFYMAFSHFNLHTLVPLVSAFPVVTFFAVLLFMPSEADGLSFRKVIVKLSGTLLIAAGIFLVTHKSQDDTAVRQAGENAQHIIDDGVEAADDGQPDS